MSTGKVPWTCPADSKGKARRRTRYKVSEKRQGGEVRCPICRYHVSFELMSFDHVVPRSKGGNRLRDNIRIAHHGCNAWRGNTRLRDARHAFRLLPASVQKSIRGRKHGEPLCLRQDYHVDSLIDLAKALNSRWEDRQDER